MKKLGLLLMTLLFFVANLSTLRAATNYPVQLTAQVLPPYGTCLSDYVVDGMERINITALQRDLTKGIYQVEVRMQVKQATKLLLTASAKYNLQAGIITKLPASNLFSALSDVQGSTKFKDNGYCFPEGAYEFVFQAFDARNNKLPVSEPAYFFAFLQKAQPPYCLFPADNACVDYTSQSINLVWTEPTVSIPSNGKRYAVEIYEMPDGFDAVRDNAESIASSLPPVYQKDDLNNAVTMHQVFQSAGLFIKGRSYAWRVRTYSVRNRMLESGNEKYNTSDYVENNGYSKFSTFHFKKCVEQNDLWKKEEKKMTFDLSLKPKIEKVDTAGSKAVVIWERDEEKFPCGYEVEWNLLDTLAAPWGRVKVPANDGRFELKGVKKGVKYVTRVRGLICPKEGSTDTIRTAYSDTLHFLLKRAESSACAHPVPANTSTVSLKEPLTNGSWMTANGHDIKVLTCEMHTEGGDTTFTGTGLVSYGFLTNLVSLTVKFDKVKINDQKELMRGMVYCNTDKDNCLDFNLNNIANKKSTGDPAQMQETNLPVYNSKSDIPNGAVGIVDGTVLDKDEKGNTKEIGKEEKEEPASCAPKTSCIDDQEATVSFSPQSDWNPPFDREQGIFTKSLSIGDYYEKIEKYTTPWVAVPAGATATVVANLNLMSGSSVKPEHVYFICRTKGQTLKLKAEKDGDNRFYVPVFGGEEGRFVEVVAMADTSKGGDAACSQLFTLGRAKVLSMKKEELTLHIVPFRREANTVKGETIEKKLNEIYQPLGKTFKVVVEERFGDGEEYDFVEDGLTVEGSGVMETETAEMSMLKVMYNEERGFSKEENQAYLFLLPKSATAGVLGDMPRNKPVGYVFADPSTTYADGHTVAHEIGHGIFTFDHAFEYYQGNQGQTDNLMDYKEGSDNNNLKVWQWSVMDTHKNYVLPFLEKDEDALKAKIQYGLFIDDVIVLSIDKKIFEDQESVAKERFPNKHFDSKSVANCDFANDYNRYDLEAIKYDVYYPILSERVEHSIRFGKINDKKKKAMYAIHDKEEETIVSFSSSPDKNGYVRNEINPYNSLFFSLLDVYYVRAEWGDGNYNTRGDDLCKSMNLYPVSFYLIPVSMVFVCEVGGAKYYLDESHNGISLNTENVRLYPLFLKRNVMLFDYELKNQEEIISLKEHAYFIQKMKLNGEEITQIPEYFSVSEGKNSYIINGYEFYVEKRSEEGGAVSVVRDKKDESFKYYIEENYVDKYYIGEKCVDVKNEGNVSVSRILYRSEEDLNGLSLYLTDRGVYDNSIEGNILGGEENHEILHVLTYKVKNGDMIKEANLHSTINMESFDLSKDVEIETMNGEKKGVVRFEKSYEGEALKPRLNMVIVNETPHEAIGEDLDKLIAALNEIYYVAGIEWQKGNLIKSTYTFSDREEEKVSVKNIAKRVNARNSEYYFIVYPGKLKTKGGAYGFALGVGGNIMTVSKEGFNGEDAFKMAVQAVAHELGHNNGLDEFAIDFYNIDSVDRNNYIESQRTMNTTNVMGYRTGFQLDFNKRQIKIMRESIKKRIQNVDR
ncbi:MAG: hypothetical protein J6Y37_16080 [Paludibacteraceae bacterium]|nr:hypothetical protein [Paludibacteraceae bacterium]